MRGAIPRKDRIATIRWALGIVRGSRANRQLRFPTGAGKLNFSVADIRELIRSSNSSAFASSIPPSISQEIRVVVGLHWYREKVVISNGLSYRRLGGYPETVFDALDSRTLFAKSSQRFSAFWTKAIHRPARARRALARRCAGA